MVEVQKTQIWHGRQKYLFIGLPRTPTSVSDFFIQPNTNNKDMHWNRLKKLRDFLHLLRCLVEWRPTSEKNVGNACFFDQSRVVDILIFLRVPLSFLRFGVFFLEPPTNMVLESIMKLICTQCTP